MVPPSWPAVPTRLRNSALGRWINYDHSLVVFRRARSPYEQIPAGNACVGRDDWSHLEGFESSERWLTRADFLRTCEQRLAAGEHVYTVAEGGRLLAYGWLVPHQERSWFPAVHQELRYPDRASVMYNAYTHPAARGRGFNTLLAAQRIADAFGPFAADAVYTAVNMGNEFAKRAKLAVGMEPWLELGCRTRLGRTQTSRRALVDGGAVGANPSAAPA